MSIKSEREKKWRKAARKTLAFELTTEKDGDILAFWSFVKAPKVDVFRNLSRLAIALSELTKMEDEKANTLLMFTMKVLKKLLQMQDMHLLTV